MTDLRPAPYMTPAAIASLSRGYLLENETIEEMYRRIAKRAAERLNRPDLEEKFFDYSYNKGWLCFSSPVLANMGTSRGYTISCFSLQLGDSVDDIYSAFHEAAMLTKGGGGLGIDASTVRGTGAPIKNNGESAGIIPWLKVLDSAMLATSQGNTRRGSAAAYLDINHVDIEDFIAMRLPKGDVNRQCQNLHHAVVIDDAFMRKCASGDAKAVALWKEIMYNRLISGEPYITYKDNVQKADPVWYKDKNLSSKISNLCNEINLHTDAEHTFVCCLSSLNLALRDEWEHTDLVETAVYFLDAVMEDFIQSATGKPGMERAVRHAVKGRPLGLGVLGFHTLLQKKGMPFDSLPTKFLNKIIFKDIHEKADAASRKLALEYGEPEWLKGHGRRNSHTTAIAPTATNSIVAGQVSPGIEPFEANIFTHKTAKGNFVVKNKVLEELLESMGKNTSDVWERIIPRGSVQDLEFLTDEQKAVFLTAREINQFAIIDLQADRTPYVEQGVSLNLFFTYPSKDALEADPTLNKKVAQYFSDVHKSAWLKGVKGLYYCKSESASVGDIRVRKEDECSWCQ